MPVREAPLKETDAGLVPDGDGWFVLNLADAPAHRHARSGAAVVFENRRDAPFPDFGLNVHVLQPGEPSCRYHSETVQEGFLVLHGEATLIVEEQERQLRAWDYFHCAPGTHHVIVGAGDGPCAVLMVGLRRDDLELHYPVSEVAAKYDASTQEETDTGAVAYRDWERGLTPERMRWPL